jgi:4-amino-4-deoxy-L-arabinose transferase
MADGGNWLELRQVGLRYYEKPPLGYWLGAASISALGHRNLAVRLPMALAAGGTALTIFLLVSAQRRRTDLALGAAIIYLTFLEVYGLGAVATLDSAFTFFVTLSLALFFQAVREPGRRRRPVWLILSGLACAGAFLTKGFTALVLPVLILAAWLPWRGLFKKHLPDCLVAVLTAGLAVLTVAPALHRANPDFWNYFFWVEHVRRFWAPLSGQHEQPFWFYLPLILGGALPWTFCLPRALGPIRAKIRAGDALVTFCLAWLVMPFLFFSACGGKILTYILPFFAPLAVMLAEALMEEPRGFSPGLQACAAFSLSLALGAVAWLVFLAPPALRIALWSDPRAWGLAAALVLTAAGLSLAANSFTAPPPGRAGAGLAASLGGLLRTALAALPIFLAASLSLPEAFTDRRAPSVLLAEAALLTPPGAALFADRTVLTAAAWHFRRNDLVLAFEQGELAYGLRWPEGLGRYVKDADGLAGLVRRELAAGRPAAVIAAGDYEKELALALGGLTPDQFLKRGAFTWRLYRPSGLQNEKPAG